MNIKEQQAESLVVSKEDMKQLMYVFSHDLRNPLVNMRALINEVKMGLKDSNENPKLLPKFIQTDLPETIEMMDEVVIRMNALIGGANDVFHGMFDHLECEKVDLDALLKREFERRKLIIDASSISYHVESLSKIWADPLAISQLVGQLLDNALRFCGEKGHVSIHIEKRANLDVLLVRDSGSGISGSDLGQVFQPFFTTDKKRSGMGLALVKALVQAHGGQVWCESTLGAGSIFYVALPRPEHM
ncbi:MAG: HAMP domain-containing sensor histidine kinase [Mariprofundaceae bacterium]